MLTRRRGEEAGSPRAIPRSPANSREAERGEAARTERALVAFAALALVLASARVLWAALATP